MIPWISRNLILPVHERLLGRPTFPLLRELQSAHKVDPQGLRERRRRMLQQVLDHARSRIPWWRERLKSAPSVVADPQQALAEIPILTRSEIREHLESLRWPDPPVKLIKHVSGGTTDDNLEFYCGRERQTWNRVLRYRALEWIGARAGDPELHLWPRFPADSPGYQFKDWLREIRDWLTNDPIVDLRPFSEQRFEAAVSRLSRLRRATLFTYPSWVLRLAEFCRRRGLTPLPGLRAVYCTGEVLHDAHRRIVAEQFGVPVFEEYGSQETGSIANEDARLAFRLNAEHVVVEILRDGRAAAPGELGEIVVTNLTATLMPFIRYATGDVARQPDDPAFPADGGNLPVFPRVEGRASDLLLATDGRLIPSRPLIDDLEGEGGVRWFHLHQTASDRVELHLLNESLGRRSAAERVVKRRLGESLTVDVLLGERFTPLRSGKHRFFCSPPAAALILHDRRVDDELARAWPQPVVVETPS